MESIRNLPEVFAVESEAETEPLSVSAVMCVSYQQAASGKCTICDRVRMPSSSEPLPLRVSRSGSHDSCLSASSCGEQPTGALLVFIM
ncbi:hypothetical protein NQZ68_019914 [Dissostichus eleginoides]|nr:hypothetical protein NQZ68_019914 [Dissostichus eleginoides]